MTEVTVAMLIPAQILPPTPEARIGPEGSGDDRADKTSESDGKRKAQDEFSAFFAALACPPRPVPPAGAVQVEEQGGLVTAEVDETAPAGTAPDTANIATPAVELPDAGGAAAATALPAAVASGGALSGSADLGAAVSPATKGKLTRPEGPANDPSRPFVAVIPAQTESAFGSERAMIVHVTVEPAANGAAGGTQGTGLGVTADASEAGNAPGIHADIGSKSPAGDAGGGQGETSHRQEERGAAAQKGTTTHMPPPAGGADAAYLTFPSPHPGVSDGLITSAPPAAADRAPHPAHAAAELVRQALPQVADTARHNGHGTIEIALNPEELGHVRLTIQSDDGATATVRLSADRHETLDLMRRHVELLAQDMRDLGYRDLSFFFQDRPQHAPFDFSRPGEDAAAPADLLPRPENSTGMPRASGRHADGSLDIRL